jgi:hypothetical protein
MNRDLNYEELFFSTDFLVTQFVIHTNQIYYFTGYKEINLERKLGGENNRRIQANSKLHKIIR